MLRSLFFHQLWKNKIEAQHIFDEKTKSAVYLEITEPQHINKFIVGTGDTLGPIVLSLVERLSLSERVPYRRFHCNYDDVILLSIEHSIELERTHF